MSNECEHEQLQVPGEFFIEIFNTKTNEKVAVVHLCMKCHLLYWEEPDDE